MWREQGRLVPTRGGMPLFWRERVIHYSDAWASLTVGVYNFADAGLFSPGHIVTSN
ncbi:MAG TPA: hypothetical protein PLM07_14980 [Candidatus Rifleibacterium sp.]|nr:hypothetical protein [Candidatus Rifleibacterium sp.]HPT47184.1 hypothetical protein [Candidatus Rifleibacterium sp.]